MSNILYFDYVRCQHEDKISHEGARSKGHPSDGPSHRNVLEAKTQYSSGTPLRHPSDIFAPALPPFPESRYAELVSGGHLPTISGAHISAPAGPCILRQQNMERQVGRQG